MATCIDVPIFFPILLGTNNRERRLETTSHRHPDKNKQSLLQCLGVHGHGVQEHSKGSFLSLLTPLLPLLPTGLKTGPKS